MGEFKSGPEEVKLIKHIDALKASIPKAKKFSEIAPKMKALQE